MVELLAMKKTTSNTVSKARMLVTKKIRRSLLSHLASLKTRRKSGSQAFKKVASRYLKPF